MITFCQDPESVCDQDEDHQRRPMKDETKILALTECLILWDYLAETGAPDKHDAVRDLHVSQKLSRPGYKASCPFCHYFGECNNCLWLATSGEVCTDHLFTEWLIARGRKTRKKAAKKVLDFLLTIEI